MKKTDIADQMARRSGISQGEAADQLDEVITSILKAVKKGGSANLPGLGQFHRDVRGALRFMPAQPRRRNGAR